MMNYLSEARWKRSFLQNGKLDFDLDPFSISGN